MKIALATAVEAFACDDDMPPLRAAFDELGVKAEPVAWDDSTVSWKRFDAVLLRSTWNYTWQLPRFLDWCETVAFHLTLINPVELVRWNTDKHYLGVLSRAGVAVIPSHFIEPGGHAESFPEHADFVVKPCIGAGSRDAQRYVASERPKAITHVQRLLDQSRSVLVQPYLAGVDERGETGLICFDGHASHAIRKGPLLRRGAEPTRALFATEHIQPRIASEAEHALAAAVLAALPFPEPVYARIDVLPEKDGPRVLEVELVEPSLFFDTSKESATRFARSVLRRLLMGGEG